MWDVPASEVEHAAQQVGPAATSADTETIVKVDPYAAAAKQAQRKAAAQTPEADERRLLAKLREPSNREMPDGLTRDAVPPIAWDQAISKRRERIEAAHHLVLASKRL